MEEATEFKVKALTGQALFLCGKFKEIGEANQSDWVDMLSAAQLLILDIANAVPLSVSEVKGRMNNLVKVYKRKRKGR